MFRNHFRFRFRYVLECFKDCNKSWMTSLLLVLFLLWTAAKDYVQQCIVRCPSYFVVSCNFSIYLQKDFRLWNSLSFFFFGRIRWVVAEPLSSPVGLAWYVFFFLAAEPSLVRYFFFSSRLSLRSDHRIPPDDINKLEAQRKSKKISLAEIKGKRPNRREYMDSAENNKRSWVHRVCFDRLSIDRSWL